MITVLQNQHVYKRKKPQLPIKKIQNEKNPLKMQHIMPGRNILESPSRQNFLTFQRRKISYLFTSGKIQTNGYASTLPVVSVIVLFLLCVFISSPYIFSLTRAKNVSRTFQFPDESSLTGYPDGFEFVDSLQDEREYGIIRIAQNVYRGKEGPTHYIVKKGDSVYSISKEYNISLYDLIRENRITDPTRLKIGDILKFPDLSHEYSITDNPDAAGMRLPEDIVISTDRDTGFAPLKVNFQLNREITAEDVNESISFMWALGNDRYVFDRQAEYTYKTPGHYNVFLIISDNKNKEVVSNKISIDVKKKNVRKLHIETKANTFITMNQINDTLDISSLVGLNRENEKKPEITISQSPELFQYIGDGQLLSIKSGYSRLTINTHSQQCISYVFVSPVPSKHSYEPPYDWYKTQFATGVNGNCGPASVAMAIHWATGEDIPVAKVRAEIGMPIKNGAINFSHMFPSFKKRKINAHHTYINNPGDVKSIIDQGNIAIIVFNTRNISKTKGDVKKNLIGRYYNDLTGHYCIIKGYTLDGKYFIVYDPIPSDWSHNSARYADGATMIGKNRYYPVSELYKTMGKKVVEIEQRP